MTCFHILPRSHSPYSCRFVGPSGMFRARRNDPIYQAIFCCFLGLPTFRHRCRSCKCLSVRRYILYKVHNRKEMHVVIVKVSLLSIDHLSCMESIILDLLCEVGGNLTEG